MSRKTRKKNDRKVPSAIARFVRPTEHREAHNDFRSAGAAVRVVPVIVRLHEQAVLSDREFEALAYYRDQASLADKSPVRSCIDFSPKGGRGPGVAIVSAQLETWRLEREMGALAPLCRAVAVDDVKLEHWIEHKLGHAVASDKDRLRQEIGIAALELKYAAGGIMGC